MKHGVEDLALFGGPKEFEYPLHVGQPNLPDRQRFLDRVQDAFDRRRLTNDGPFLEELEERLATLLGVSHCIAVCNGTTGLQLVATAAGLTGEVIVPSFTFIATPHALRWQHLDPIFCDVDPVTHNLDAKSVERALTERTSAILPVHLWGRPCDIDSLKEIADRRGLMLLFDAAHAFAAGHRGVRIGGFGDAEVFSFHATKMFNTFEGGAITTNDASLAARIRLMRNFGFADYDEVVSLGTNGKMNEVSAAMGLTALESLDELVEANRRNYNSYAEGLREIAGLRLMEYEKEDLPTYQYVVVEVDEEQTGMTRDELQQVLWAENVLCRRYFYPGCHRMDPYRSEPQPELPNTERLAARVLSLPTGAAVESYEIERLCDLIRFIIVHATTLPWAHAKQSADPAVSGS